MDREPTAEPALLPNRAGQALCRLDEIPDGAAKGFELESGDEPLEIFAVREGSRVFAYLNVCPHTGSPLDWQPDDFMSEEGAAIMCHTHGALFEIDGGFCIAGPCAGDKLTPVNVAVDEDGYVILGETVRDEA